MATALALTDTDSPTLKRSFTFDDDPLNHDNSPSPKKVEFCIPEVQLVAPTPCYPTRHSLHFHTNHRRRQSVEKAGRSFAPFRTSMQAQPSPRMFAAPMPFNSVMDNGSQSVVASFITNYDPASQKELSRPASSGDSSYSSINPSFSSFHQPRNSTSTSASESSDSSPTTTVSTIDSSSITESSPGTSPETPGSSSISSLSGMTDAPRFKPPERSRTEPFFEMQRPATPAKKARNLKNLAVDTTTATYSLSRVVTSAPLAASQTVTAMDKVSAPVSPVFVKPPTPPRRKFSNLGLTIVTSANSNVARLTVPPTPSMTRPNTLRHFQSSPSLPLVTPSAGPPVGMRLPTIRDHSALEGFADIPLENVNEDQEANFDVPQSLEEKADSYPNGPIRIYESGIDLYYEPSLEVACQYDVILNVASEVKNPFASGEVPQNVTAVQSSPIVGVLADPSQDSSSPSTPKATPISTTADTVNEPLPTNQPEYIHIPWEHNTDIVPDLHRLVKLIDERVSQGKKVLVHCQCGVSRSASLIVAYGLYKNPGTTVQEAYDAVKRRSKWIGPNMNLIMQLQEFRSSLLRTARREHGYSSQLFTLPRKLSTAVSSASTTDHFTPETESGPVTPRTAPLPPENASPIMRASAGNMGPFSAGPVEPAQGSFWEPGFRRSWGSNSTTDLTLQAVSVSDTPYVDAKGYLVPIVTVMEKEQGLLSLSPEAHTYSPAQLSLERSKSLKRNTINFSKPLSPRRDSEDSDCPMQDAGVPILSPRSEEFHMTPVATENTLIEKHDASGIFSPFASSFAQNPFDRMKKISEHSPSGLSIHEQILRLPSFHSSPSPTQQSKPFCCNDSLEPAVPPTTPSHKRSVRTKFSSPSLREQIHLQRLQTQIEASLPHSPGSQHSLDDIDALMSPRATEFTLNPFHALLSPSTSTPQRQLESEPPATPTSSASDPRSPAQHGISPITRNILDVL